MNLELPKLNTNRSLEQRVAEVERYLYRLALELQAMEQEETNGEVRNT